jgi:hypothetical protein
MKTAATLVLFSALSASAFVPVHRPVGAQTSLQITPEEDLELTRKVIAKFLGEDFSSESAPSPAPAAVEVSAPKEESTTKSKK